MGFYEHFGPLVYFCQFLGLFPYRIESSHPSKPLKKRFTFSWCHPLTVWCVLAFVLQLLPVVAIANFFHNMEHVISTMQTNIPKSIPILTGLGAATNISMVFVSRAVTLRYSRLRLAVESITVKVIKELEEFEAFPNCKQTSKQRTYFGIVTILTLGCINVYLVWNSSYDPLNFSTAFIIPTICGFVLFFIAIDSPLLLFHLSYYSMAHYIQLLRVKMTSGKNRNEPFKECKLVLLHLREACDALNSVFSFPILYVITTKLVIVSAYLFAIIYIFIHPTVSYATTSIFFFCAQVVNNVIHLLVVLHAADMPVHQMRHFREQVIALANTRLNKGIDIHFEVLSLLQHADEERFRLSAAGLFQVGFHLLPAVTGSIVTYLVILLQYQFTQ